MSWAFLDDTVHEHPKQNEIGGAASWYWAMGLTYCRRLEEERRRRGERVDFIPKASALVLFADPKAKQHVAAILRVGLWKPTGDAPETPGGGYLVHDYADVYGNKVTNPPSQQRPSADNQQSQLSESQLNARRAGGRARAEQASRGPAARFQQSTSKEPASRASGSGSGSGTGSDSDRELGESDPKDLSGFPARKRGERPRPRSDLLRTRVMVADYEPLPDHRLYAEEIGVGAEAFERMMLAFRDRYGGKAHDAPFLDDRLCAWIEQEAKPRPSAAGGARPGWKPPDAGATGWEGADDVPDAG